MNRLLIDACFSRKTAHTPVWYMRQAGRFLPEYKKLKGEKNILEVIQIPELAAQICLSPVKALGVDAAILYADIMIPLLGIGVDLEIVENVGPVIHQPFREIKEIKKLRNLNPEEDVPYLLETIKLLKKELKVPLIGFSGAPFTLASYLIEGKPTRDFIKTKSLMYQDKKAWELLMGKLTQLIITYLQAQKEAGVEVIQLFDSWVGCLSEGDFREYVLPYSKKIFEELSDGKVPLIHFGTNTASFLEEFASVKCEVVSVDWRISISKGWQQIGLDKAIQGNLDPVILMADFPVIKKRVDEIFSSLPKKEGYIFNLGHGVLPGTPVENVIRLTEYIHENY
jgi:uroporphyrinogen decarboxylase